MKKIWKREIKKRESISIIPNGRGVKIFLVTCYPTKLFYTLIGSSPRFVQARQFSIQAGVLLSGTISQDKKMVFHYEPDK